MKVSAAIIELTKMDSEKELHVQMSSPNGHTFATGRLESIFHNGEHIVVDTYVEDSENSDLLDTEDSDGGY